MITAEHPFKSLPRVSGQRFVQVLTDAGSPWADQAGDLFDLIRENDHDPAVWLAICGREHSFGTNRSSVMHRNQTNSWTNARSVRLAGLQHEIIYDSVRGGPYVRYRSVSDSLHDGMYRIDDPGYVYRRSGARTIVDVLRLWTESEHHEYVRYVVESMNRWRSFEPPYNHVIRGMVDIRQDLATRKPGSDVPAGPFARVALTEKQGLVIHYSGPPVQQRDEPFAVLRGEAAYHVRKNWASPDAPTIYGDGLMYHIAVGGDGTTFLCRNLEAVLWHCGVTRWNRQGLSVHLPLGGDQRATSAQLAGLSEVVDSWLAYTGTERSQVFGHRELSPTSCPGTLMEDFVYPYRDGAQMSDGQWFDETRQYVGGAFWAYWLTRGGLPIFGYPLTGEMQETCEDGQACTVQYFERAVFEWRPENEPQYQVQLRRLGASALSLLQG